MSDIMEGTNHTESGGCHEINHTLLNVAKSKGIADTHFNIQGKKWINVLKAMDEGLIQKDFLRSLN